MSSIIGLQPLWLLLLPSPPREITLHSIRNVYASTISQVLQKTAGTSVAFSTVTILEIALPCPNVSTSKEFHYSYLQNLLQQVYSLICLLCTEHCIDVQYGNDVDVRVLLFQHPSLDKSKLPQKEGVDNSSIGPIVTLQRLASCDRQWQRVCSMDREDGEVLLQVFLRLRKSSFEDEKDRMVIERFAPEFQSSTFSDPTSIKAHDMECRTHHESVAVGGTFDHLHIGHKLLLSMTALVLSPAVPSEAKQNKSLTVGITGDKLLENKKFREHLQDWHRRQAAVRAFLSTFLVMDSPTQQDSSDNKEGQDNQQRAITESWPSGLTIKYVEIFDPFGPTITDESISALVLSQETRAGGKAVNDKRAEKEWPALDVFEVDVLDLSGKDAGASSEEAHDFQNKISSTEIRRRLGERSGTANGNLP